ncbi:MAG: thiopurine S-methyltransferase, partial [Thermomonas sp.]
MHADFWHQRWTEGRIGFHQSEPTPLLVKHWPAVGIAPDAKVFVPLCGKSLDMAWLAAQGYRVLGIELSPLAVEEFFDEHDLIPEIEDSRYGRHYRAEGIELICGDAFALDEAVLADCTAVIDRAALIALPPDLRQRYASELYAHLPTGCAGLLVTLEYPQHEKDGPPFAVQADEVQALFGTDWTITQLERVLIPADHP